MSAVDRHSRLAHLFEEALAQPADRREPHMAQACGDDVELLAELRELLRHHEADGPGRHALAQPILAQPVNVAAVLDAAVSRPVADQPQEIEIPGFRIVRRLGQGGMGVVYLAEQDKPRRDVAIKLMRPGLASPALLKRFDLEQEVLGRLQHPGIAQIHGAGECHPYGFGGPSQPYFVMEFVRGVALDEFCRAHSLATHERLRLLVQVCEAVHHAHVRGVVHRDLKPGNILVDHCGDQSTLSNSEQSSRSLIKILDFGVARVATGDMQLTTLNTGVGQLIGTLAYMSPEQASGDSASVDARSDVYALGVIGYETLTGRLPHALSASNPAEAARIIRDEDPQPLSVVDRVFRGDLDTIFAKALEKDPSRRYGSAAEFAADVQRFLDDQPIIARPASTIYNLRKFARRNRGLVAGVAAAFIVLVLGIIGTTVAMLEAQTQRDDATAAKTAADREADTARAVTKFLQEMLSAPDPLARVNAVTDDPKETRIIDMLDNASAKVGERFVGQPIVEADVCTVLARTYSHLGEFDKAEILLKRAIELFEQHLDSTSARTIDTVGALGTLYMMQHRFDEADALKQKEIELGRIALGADSNIVLSAMEQLGLMRAQRSDYDGALTLLNELLEIRRRILGPDHGDTINTMYNVCWVHLRAGQLETALPMSVELEALGERVFGEDDERTISYRNNVAYLYERSDRVEDAERMHARNVERGRATMAATDWHLGVYLHNHASALRRLERYEDAEPLQLEAIAIFEKNFEPEHRRMHAAIDGAIALYEAWGKAEEAERWRERRNRPTTEAATAPDAASD